MKRFGFLIGLGILIACGEPNSTGELKVYDLKSFYEEILINLQNQSPTLEKVVEVGKEKEEKVFQSPDWKKELAFLSDCHLNKPALLGMYEELKSEITLSYTLLEEDADKPIKSLKIELNPKGRPLSIWMEMEEKNPLYFGQTSIQLLFKEEGEQLSEYEIKKVKKVIGSNSEISTIRGRLIY